MIESKLNDIVILKDFKNRSRLGTSLQYAGHSMAEMTLSQTSTIPIFHHSIFPGYHRYGSAIPASRWTAIPLGQAGPLRQLADRNERFGAFAIIPQFVLFLSFFVLTKGDVLPTSLPLYFLLLYLFTSYFFTSLLHYFFTSLLLYLLPPASHFESSYPPIINASIHRFTFKSSGQNPFHPFLRTYK